MQNNNLIAINDFCISHNIEIAFVSSLKQNGLIQVVTIQEAEFIDADQLSQLEKFVRFYYELDINLEGIETITHLLQRINLLQDEVSMFRNRLRFYEA
jgi:hypothetical protein